MALVTVLLALSGTRGDAEPISRTGQSEADWRYTWAFYVFLPAKTSGTSTVAGTAVPLNLNLSDAVQLLDISAAGQFET